MAKRGRPPVSPIRQNIVELLMHIGPAHAYEIYQHYRGIFPKGTQRSIYYQLSRGLQTHEFVIDRVSDESGDYSWGPIARKIYYKLGPAAMPTFNEKVKEYCTKLIEK